MADSQASDKSVSDDVDSAGDITASQGAATLTGADETPAFDGRLKIGGQFRHLRVHSKLGEGAMGAAYLASHPILQMPLVIKIFKATVDSNIFREAHLAARVVSPNVVSVLDAGYEFDVPFVIQRYIDGIDLDELITYLQLAQWHLPVNMICRILIDGANGLHAIHQAGIIHRDVKPANLFLRGSGVSRSVILESLSIPLKKKVRTMSPGRRVSWLLNSGMARRWAVIRTSMRWERRDTYWQPGYVPLRNVIYRRSKPPTWNGLTRRQQQLSRAKLIFFQSLRERCANFRLNASQTQPQWPGRSQWWPNQCLS